MNDEEALRIQDLVEIPDVKTVIQLEDLKDPGLSRMIAETFVLTREVVENLQAVFTGLSKRAGRGIFLKGHFGSGKSHFLSMLSLLLKHPETWEILTAQENALGDFEKDIQGLRFFLVDISLVNHRGSEFLEDIVLKHLFALLGDETSGLLEQAEARHETFRAVKENLDRKGFSGLVFLIDELSEFLRSKPDARSYNEDIRFLQYLGEEARAFPLWVIATLQEWIEETGEIHQDTFNKIKDRYPVRLSLGRAHIEELISERLIRHREGSHGPIGDLYDRLKAYFPTFPVTKERFTRLYPVHPATSSLLDRLKPLFSEHRGVVDFIHFRLKGDPERHIPSMLDEPAHRLLTPELIFDHFLTRIRERSETQLYTQRVYESYRELIPAVFQDEDQRRMALAAVKLLILFAVSPVSYRYTLRHMAEMLLFQVTQLEAEINYQFLLDILEKLMEEGDFIRVEAREDPLDNHYYIDLKADMASIMRRKIRHKASEIFAEDERLFWKTGVLVQAPHLPLESWIQQSPLQLHLKWHHTHRTGSLFLRQLDEVTLDDVKTLARRWKRTEEDFFLFVGTPLRTDAQRSHVRDILLPWIRENQQGTFLFWEPAAVEDPGPMRETLAALLMKEARAEEPGEKTGEAERFLEGFIDKSRKELLEAFSKAYHRGTLFWDENRVELTRFGYLSQEKLILEFIPDLLERRFPRHTRIQPYMEPPTPGILQDMLRDFLASGEFVMDNRSKAGLRDLIDGLLRPLGLIKKKGNRYELQLNPKHNELVRHFFDVMGAQETVSPDEIYWRFRKGEYGLTRPHFELLVLAMLFTGNLVAYKGGKRRPPDEVARTGLKSVAELGRGEILGEASRALLATHPLIPADFKKAPLTLVSQEELWARTRAAKPAAVEELEALRSRVKWAAGFQAFKNMPWNALLEDIREAARVWDEVKVSLNSREGLDRFLKTGDRDPYLERRLERIRAAQRFMERAERALFIHQYVTDPRLQIPEGERYRPLKDMRERILGFFQATPESVSPEALDSMVETFQEFQEAYVRIYSEDHRHAKAHSRFDAYEHLARSKRYQLLKRLDRLEMISVEHDLRSIDKRLQSILLHRCLRNPQDALQGQPVCSCGFRLGEQVAFPPLKDLERNMDRGIVETLEAVQAPAIQEKIAPYLESLDVVGKAKEAEAVRKALALSPKDGALLEKLDKLLIPPVVEEINAAFRGKVVVVERDVDELHRLLAHRKYTLVQARRILRDWLNEESVSEDTFLHFTAREEKEASGSPREAFRDFLETEHSHLLPLLQEMGGGRMIKAVITCLWAELYALPIQKILRILPALDRGKDEESGRWAGHLADLARAFRDKGPGHFKALAVEVQEDAGYVQALWSALAALSPAEVFAREAFFPQIMKEAFERLLNEMQEKAPVSLAAITSEADPGLSTDAPAGPFQEEKEEMIRALSDYREFKERAAALKAPGVQDPKGFSQWESHYIRDISPLPSLSRRLDRRLEGIGTGKPRFLTDEQKAVEASLQEAATKFARFYREALAAWREGETPRPVMIRDIPVLLKTKRKVPDHRRVLYVLMDGMRWDLWEAIKSELIGKRQDLVRVVRQGALWSGRPSNTREQLAELEDAFREAGEDPTDSDTLWKLTGMDEKVHAEKGPLDYLVSAVVDYLRLDFLPPLKKLPSGTLIILFADHGFIENPAFRPTDKYQSPRYLHGKDSPFEVIVPWAWLMRI